MLIAIAVVNIGLEWHQVEVRRAIEVETRRTSTHNEQPHHRLVCALETGTIASC